jgi:Bacterial type II and III secretion system protein
LISTNNSTVVNGIPLLSQIPVFGALFRNSTTTKIKQEVIIVVTPHVVPLEDKFFSYIIPKDTDQFDRFDKTLFRNAYRIRGNDLFDLSFVNDSNVLKELRKRVATANTSNRQIRTNETFQSLLNGGIPGEDIYVRRMLWEIIDKTHYARYVNPDKIIFYESDPSTPGGFKLAFLNAKLKAQKAKEENDLSISFEAHPHGTVERPFVPPKGEVSYPSLTRQNYLETLINGNDRNPDGTAKDWMVLLSKNSSGITVRANSVTPLELLQGVMVLKRLLELNKTMPLTLKDFHIGREIIFPSQEELQQGFHIIDRETAELFYEVYNYYPAFEQEFNRATRQIDAALNQAGIRQQ